MSVENVSAKKKKVGLITLSLPREKTDLAENFDQNAHKSLISTGFDIIANDGLREINKRNIVIYKCYVCCF